MHLPRPIIMLGGLERYDLVPVTNLKAIVLSYLDEIMVIGIYI